MILSSKIAYSEVYEILNLLEKEYSRRIPKKFIDFLKKEKPKEYEPNIRVDIPLVKQNLKRETMVLLSILNIKYWCDTKEEKQKFINELIKNKNKN